MRPSQGSYQNRTVHAPGRWSWVGVSGFLFFLLKGLLWLIAPAWLALR